MPQTINTPDIHIRQQLHPGDLGYVAYLHGKVYAEENNYNLNFEGYVLEGLAELARQYDPEKDRVWICEQQQKIVGFLTAMQRGEAVQLRYFLLLPECRGLGLGKKLMDSFMAFVKEKGYRSAYLWTTHEQETAAGLYIRHGFRLTEEKTSQHFGKELVEKKFEWLP
jgi:peptidyl-dipeptidase Dcp